MFVVDRDYYVRAAAEAALNGSQFASLAHWAAEQKAQAEAAKVVSFASWREQLRPSATAER